MAFPLFAGARVTRLGVLIVGLALVPMLSLAASFNCTKAATTQEKLVCSDAELSKLDEELAIEYRKALPGPQEPRVRERQTEWLQQERNKCPDAVCLKA